MAARRRIRFGLMGLSALLALLFLCTEARAAVDVSYGAAARTQLRPGDTVLLYTGPAETTAEAKAAAKALARERAYYEAQGAEVYAFVLGGLHADTADAAQTAIAPDAATLSPGVAALSERAAQAGFDILCCNLSTAAGEAVFLPGKLYGSTGVLAFTDPAALTKLPSEARAAYDMNGEVARVLIEYAAAQLRAQGASTTVLLAVCPVEEAGRPWRGEDLRMQCTGIDVWIEAQAPANAAEGPTVEGLVLYAAPGAVGALRIPGAAQAEAAAVQAGPAMTAKPTETARPMLTVQPRQTARPTQTPRPTQTAKPAQTVKPAQAARPAQTPQPIQTAKPTETPNPVKSVRPTAPSAALARTESPVTTTKPVQTVQPAQTARPAQTPQPAQPAKTLRPTPAPSAAPAETPYSMSETAGIPSSGSPGQARPLSPGEAEARRALALEEGKRRQDYIPPNAVYTGDAARSPLLFAAGALCFAFARALGRRRGGRA